MAGEGLPASRPWSCRGLRHATACARRRTVQSWTGVKVRRRSPVHRVVTCLFPINYACPRYSWTFASGRRGNWECSLCTTYMRLWTSREVVCNPRNKVALKPGHSLMDWIRLGQSGCDLTGVKGILQEVTPSQLAKHNKRNDAWLAIRGRVYNVTRYMDFHPGGEEELMKGVGCDATQLFNQVHAWVNFESLLQKCLVGHLRKCESSRLPDLGALLFKSKKNSKEMLINKTSDASNDTPPTGNLTRKDSSKRVPVPLDWFQKLNSVTLVYYTKSLCPQVDVQLKNSKDLSVSISIGENCLLSHVSLEDEVLWPCKVVTNSDTGKVEVHLQKNCLKLWHGLGSMCGDNGLLCKAAGVCPYMTWLVVDVCSVTYNTRLIVLRNSYNVLKVVPIGHHVRVRSNVQGLEVIRCYTPVPPCLPGSVPPPSWGSDCLCLMVKEYQSGALTPWLCDLGPGDQVDLSGPEGSFSTRQLQNATQLYLLAAGTGLTPMLELISWALDGRGKKCQKINMMFFNRSQHDILWQDQLDNLQKIDDRFTVVHMLSEPDDDWSGQRGRVDKACVNNFVPNVSTNKELFICICGPDAFTEVTRRLLDELGCPENQLHCFQG